MVWLGYIAVACRPCGMVSFMNTIMVYVYRLTVSVAMLSPFVLQPAGAMPDGVFAVGRVVVETRYGHPWLLSF